MIEWGFRMKSAARSKNRYHSSHDWRITGAGKPGCQLEIFMEISNKKCKMKMGFWQITLECSPGFYESLSRSSDQKSLCKCKRERCLLIPFASGMSAFVQVINTPVRTRAGVGSHWHFMIWTCSKANTLLQTLAKQGIQWFNLQALGFKDPMFCWHLGRFHSQHNHPTWRCTQQVGPCWRCTKTEIVGYYHALISSHKVDWQQLGQKARKQKWWVTNKNKDYCQVWFYNLLTLGNNGCQIWLPMWNNRCPFISCKVSRSW